jgi:hypothetical protein
VDYSGTLRDGWLYTWKHKWLWLLALIPTLAGVVGLLPSLGGSVTPDMTPDEMMGMAGRSLLMSCLSLILILVIWLVGLAARGGIIAGVARLARGEATGFGPSFREGWRKVWSLLGMSILLFGWLVILVIVMIVLFLIPIMTMALTGGLDNPSEGLMAGLGTLGLLALCCLSVVFFLLALLLNLIYPFAYRGIMLRELGAVESIRHGWQVLRDNLGEILLLALPFFVLTLILGAALGIANIAITSPDVFNPTGVMESLNAVDWRFLIAFLVVSLFSSLLAAWQSATFTLAYLDWTGKDVLKDGLAPAMM